MTESRPSSYAPGHAVVAGGWPWIASIWFGVALFDATQNVVVMHAEGMHHAWARLFVFRILTWLVWALATPWVLRLGRAHPPRWPGSGVSWLMHLGACFLIGLAFATWSAFLDWTMDPWLRPSGPQPFAKLWSGTFFGGLLSYVVLYATILTIGYGLDSRERLVLQQAETARLNERIVKAQLDALRRQIEPQFLFNALNAVAGLVREKRNEAAVGMIAAVSDLLRRVLDESDRHLVSLGEELEFLQKYFDIQKMRFGERAQIGVDVADALLAAQVPSLILQPFAENAFKHGIARRAQGGAIRVSASRAGGMLTLSLFNDGPGLPPGPAQSRVGIGFANATERLKGLYGDRFNLSMRNRDEGVEVLIAVPYAEA